MTNARIFLHTPEPASSPALYLDELTRALTDLALPVHVICPANHQAIASFERNARVAVHPTAPRSTHASAGLLMKLWLNLGFLLSSCTVLLRSVRSGDIVHFQYVLHFPFGALLFLCALARRSAIVFTVHDPLPHKWLLPRSLRLFEKGALGWAYRVSRLLLVHSESGKNTLIEHFPGVTEKIRVIAHGPYEFGVGLPSPPPSDVFELLLFGSLRENKGAHLAIAAVQTLHRAGVPLRLTIAGAVPNRKEQAYWQECRKLIQDCPGPIRLLEKFIPDEQVAELFAACHSLLLPYTSFSSDSGVAYMALANRRPIICTRSGGLGSLLHLSGGGLPIEEATVTGVAATLRQAVALGPEYLAHLARRGSAWVLSECSWSKVARQTLQLYAEAQTEPDRRPFYVAQVP